MADLHKPIQPHPRTRHGHRAARELAGFIAALLLALLSAPFFWI